MGEKPVAVNCYPPTDARGVSRASFNAPRYPTFDIWHANRRAKKKCGYVVRRLWRRQPLAGWRHRLGNGGDTVAHRGPPDIPHPVQRMHNSESMQRLFY